MRFPYDVFVGADYTASMYSQEPGENAQERTALREAARAELARSDGAPRFTGVLTARYAADQGGPRSRELRKLSVFGAVVYCVVVLIVHLVVMPHPNKAAFLTQLLVFPPVIFLAARAAARPSMSAFAREGIVLGLCCLVVTGAILDIAVSSTSDVLMNMFLIVAPVIGCMFFTRMSPMQGALFIGFCTASMIAVILARADIPQQMRLYPLGCMLSAALFALYSLHELDGAMRRLYLHALAQTLRSEDLAVENRALDVLSTTDALTGARNRRHFEKTLADLRPCPPASHFLLLIDVDYFKQLNDKFGHPAGDACLRQAAAFMRGMLRPSDTIARLGGDEFAILMHHSTWLEARRLADRLCVGIASHVFEADSRLLQLTVTIGGAEWDPNGEAAQVFAMADAALYQAKAAGRARAVWARAEDLDARRDDAEPFAA